MKIEEFPIRAGWSVLVFAVLAAFQAPASAQQIPGCGDLRPPGQYGPFDYRTLPEDVRHRVEDYHFTPDVEGLRHGATGANAGGDLDYTLRAFPNSPRALLAMTRYGAKTSYEKPPGARYTVECYLERAVRFAPDDPMPHMVFANYLKARKRLPDAKRELDAAESLRGEPSSFDLDYNLGLLYVDVGEYDKAQAAAKRAYELGAPLPGLMRKLKAVGKWSQ